MSEVAIPEVPAPPHPDWPVWQCEIEPLSKEATVKAWTVGDKHLLKCEGPSAQFSKDPISFGFPEEMQTYTLHPLKLTKFSDTAIELVVTAYKPGEHNLPWLEIKTGETGVRTENLQWKVEALVPPGGQTKPHFDLPLFGLAYSIWLFVAIGLVLLTPIVIGLWRWRRRINIRSMVDQVELASSRLSPYEEFHKSLRSLARTHQFAGVSDPVHNKEFVNGLEKAFKVFLTRLLQIPAHVWSASKLERTLKSHQRGRYKLLAKELKSTLIEIEKAQSEKQVSDDDVRQIKNHSVKLALWFHQHASLKGKTA